MIHSAAPNPGAMQIPGVEDLRREARRRDFGYLIAGILIAGVVGLISWAGGSAGPVIAAAMIAAPICVFLLWNNPKLAVYLVVGSACLFELQRVPYDDGITDRIPMFWNINTIFQTYARMNMKSVPFDPLETLLIVTGAASLLRGMLTKQIELRLGNLILPIGAYAAYVVFGWVNGVIISGGDPRLALMEMRPQLLFLLAYLLGVNLIRKEEDVTPLIWTVVICVGLKGILYTYRRYVTLAGLPLDSQGVGSHEEAFFFDCFAALLMVLWLSGAHRRIQGVMWALLPFVVLGNLACNRRAGTAAMVIAFAVMLPAAFAALEKRRKLVTVIAVIIAITGPAYFFAFRRSQSAFAAPARAINSQFEPDPRDEASNAYRDAEDENLMLTMRRSPVIGYGYGRRMLHEVPMDDISSKYEYWDLLPHNQILWVWMRLGTVGFTVFWLMISAIVVRTCLAMRAPNASPSVRAISLFTLLCITMLLMFGLLDLQLSNKRDMLFAGVWVGVIGGLPASIFAAKKAGEGGAE